MTDELYQDLILEHSKNPLNFGCPDSEEEKKCFLSTHLQNPLCGDEIHFFAKIENGRIIDCRFEGFGCSISKAAASILSEQVKGRTFAEIERIIGEYKSLLSLKSTSPEINKPHLGSTKEPGSTQGQQVETEDLGDLIIFEGIRNYPNRVKCATLAVEALARIISSEKSREKAGL